MGIASALTAKRWSIDFSEQVNLEPVVGTLDASHWKRITYCQALPRYSALDTRRIGRVTIETGGASKSL
jgi:hypothetical protein